MRTIKLSEVAPDEKVALFKALKLPLSTEGILILEYPKKPDYKPGSQEHLNYLLEHDPNMLGIMIINLNYEITLGTLGNNYDFPLPYGAASSINNIMKSYTSSNSPTFRDFNDLVDSFPYGVIDGSVELIYETGKGYGSPLQMTMFAPATLGGHFQITEDVENSFYDEDIAMLMVKSTLDIRLFSLENKDDDHVDDIFFTTGKEDLELWMDARGEVKGDELHIARMMNLDLKQWGEKPKKRKKPSRVKYDDEDENF